MTANVDLSEEGYNNLAEREFVLQTMTNPVIEITKKTIIITFLSIILVLSFMELLTLMT